MQDPESFVKQSKIVQKRSHGGRIHIDPLQAFRTVALIESNPLKLQNRVIAEDLMIQSGCNFLNTHLLKL